MCLAASHAPRYRRCGCGKAPSACRRVLTVSSGTKAALTDSATPDVRTARRASRCSPSPTLEPVVAAAPAVALVATTGGAVGVVSQADGARTAEWPAEWPAPLAAAELAASSPNSRKVASGSVTTRVVDADSRATPTDTPDMTPEGRVLPAVSAVHGRIPWTCFQTLRVSKGKATNSAIAAAIHEARARSNVEWGCDRRVVSFRPMIGLVRTQSHHVGRGREVGKRREPKFLSGSFSKPIIVGTDL